MPKTYLKIKIMSLASESRIIRREEKKWPGTSVVYQGLHNHRVVEVRQEARASLLAYGFLRGRSYAALEKGGHNCPPTTPDWPKVLKLAQKYGADSKLSYDKIKAWAETQIPPA